MFVCRGLFRGKSGSEAISQMIKGWVEMDNWSVFLKSVICVLSSMVMSLLLIITIRVSDFYNAMILGGFCGIIIAVVTKSETRKKTITARIIGLLSAVMSQLLLLFSDIPYCIIMFIYGNYDLEFYGEEAERWFGDIEHFIENEVFVYDWCVVFLLYGLFISFCVGIVMIFLLDKMKSYKKGHNL
ncbi:MAG: hypothetical protein HFG54_11615 [Lachnospiraceae bacterium]|jgi:uncharacterized membrane protein YedE/YeeE|nr:hypothetical protein [Lachnospiraceae bacterium]